MRVTASRARRLAHVAMLLALAVLSGGAGVLMHPLMLDDAYITYSFARNFARFGQLVHSQGVPYLATSAPLYAVILSIPHLVGLSIPAVSNILGAISVFGTGLSLYLLCRRHGQMWAGAVAGLLAVSAPLLWLSLGLETCFFVFLVCGAFYLYDRDRYVLTAVLLALATLTRADGLLAAAILGTYHVVVARRGVPWPAVLAYLATCAPLVIYLQLSFGSPLPATLGAKRAQVELGITGFFVKTTLLEGLGILLEGWATQCVLYVFYLPLLLLGLFSLLRARWVWGIVAWSVLHLIAYAVLNVSPYFWYYAPLVPGAALLVGLGSQWLARRVLSQPVRILLALLPLCTLAAQMVSLVRMADALSGPIPPVSEAQQRVLPGTSDQVYRKVGEWLNANTSPDAVVGVTEVGIMGYYADRTMIDFLGVLRPDVAQALQHGDLYYAIPHYMPDYLVLGPDLGTFGLALGEDSWFLSNYKPVHQVFDNRSWSVPLIILQRQTSPAPLVEHASHVSFGENLTLERLVLEDERLRLGSGVRVRLDWVRKGGAPRDLLAIVYLDGPDGEMKVWAESRANTAKWPVGQILPTYYLFYLDPDLLTGDYTLGVRVVLDGQDNVIRMFGKVRVEAGK